MLIGGINMEIWRDIEGYEGLYQVSNLGKVRSLNYNGVRICIIKCMVQKESDKLYQKGKEYYV